MHFHGRILGGNRKKYGSRKVEIDGRMFDSKKEATRYCQLVTLQKAGKISGLECQKAFELIPAQREPSTMTKTGKEKLGKVIEKSVKYIADFVYYQNGVMVVEDTKGFRTTDYIIKRKLMLYVYGIKIKEI